MIALPKAITSRLTRPNVATLLMLGGGMVMTLGGAVTIHLLAYRPMPGPEIAAVARIDGIAKIGLLCTAFAGSVLIVLGLIVLNIDRLSASGAGFSVALDRVDEPPTTTAIVNTTVAVQSERAE